LPTRQSSTLVRVVNKRIPKKCWRGESLPSRPRGTKTPAAAWLVVHLFSLLRVYGQLTQGFTQHVLIDASARAAASQLAVDHDRRKAADAVLRGTAGNLMLVHVAQNYLVFRTC
jgi:hypothetical protein